MYGEDKDRIKGGQGGILQHYTCPGLDHAAEELERPSWSKPRGGRPSSLIWQREWSRRIRQKNHLHSFQPDYKEATPPPRSLLYRGEWSLRPIPVARGPTPRIPEVKSAAAPATARSNATQRRTPSEAAASSSDIARRTLPYHNYLHLRNIVSS